MNGTAAMSPTLQEPNGADFFKYLREVFDEYKERKFNMKSDFHMMKNSILQFLMAGANHTAATARAANPINFPDGTQTKASVPLRPAGLRIAKTNREKLMRAKSQQVFVDLLFRLLNPPTRKARGPNKRCTPNPPVGALRSSKRMIKISVEKLHDMTVQASQAKVNSCVPGRDDEKPPSTTDKRKDNLEAQPSHIIESELSSESDVSMLDAYRESSGKSNKSFSEDDQDNFEPSDCGPEGMQSSDEELDDETYDLSCEIRFPALDSKKPPREPSKQFNLTLDYLESDISEISPENWLIYRDKILDLHFSPQIKDLDLWGRLMKVVRICFLGEEMESLVQRNWARLEAVVRTCARIAEVISPDVIDNRNFGKAEEWVRGKAKDIAWWKDVLAEPSS